MSERGRDTEATLIKKPHVVVIKIKSKNMNEFSLNGQGGLVGKSVAFAVPIYPDLCPSDYVHHNKISLKETLNPHYTRGV